MRNLRPLSALARIYGELQSNEVVVDDKRIFADEMAKKRAIQVQRQAMDVHYRNKKRTRKTQPSFPKTT